MSTRKRSSTQLPKARPLQAVLKDVLARLKRFDRNSYFHEPVPRDVPQYYNIIKNPMSFQQMEAKLKDEQYKNLAAFETDFCLITENCCTFNEENTPYFKAAVELKNYGMIQISKSSEEILEDTPSPPQQQQQEEQQRRLEQQQQHQQQVQQLQSSYHGLQAVNLAQARLSPAPHTSIEPAKKKRKYVKSGLYKKSNLNKNKPAPTQAEIQAAQEAIRRQEREKALALTQQVQPLHSSQPSFNRQLLSPGLINDFGMKSTPSMMDFAHIWHLEQERQRVQRMHSNRGVQTGPLHYDMQRPHGEHPFEKRYPMRLWTYHEGLADCFKGMLQTKLARVQVPVPKPSNEYFKPSRSLLRLIHEDIFKPTFIPNQPFGVLPENLQKLDTLDEKYTKLLDNTHISLLKRIEERLKGQQSLETKGLGETTDLGAPGPPGPPGPPLGPPGDQLAVSTLPVLDSQAAAAGLGPSSVQKVEVPDLAVKTESPAVPVLVPVVKFEDQDKTGST